MRNMIADKVSKNKSKVENKKRCLSPDVGSIQYRAPEAVMREK
jgi:hypothetical protein